MLLFEKSSIAESDNVMCERMVATQFMSKRLFKTVYCVHIMSLIQFTKVRFENVGNDKRVIDSHLLCV
jgi:hypothetical protein